ncbi:MAG: gluconokinase, partial [Bacteroidota bacterium]
MYQIIFVMGVSGSGKSTIGRLLGQTLRVPFFDADDFHPPENIQKMENGIALNDEDRHIWLEKIRAKAESGIQQESIIFACSALKEKYRIFLSQGRTHQVKWIYLAGDFDL